MIHVNTNVNLYPSNPLWSKEYLTIWTSFGFPCGADNTTLDMRTTQATIKSFIFLARLWLFYDFALWTDNVNWLFELIEPLLLCISGERERNKYPKLWREMMLRFKYSTLNNIMFLFSTHSQKNCLHDARAKKDMNL